MSALPPFAGFGAKKAGRCERFVTIHLPCTSNAQHKAQTMARFLYRILRVVNIVGRFEENALREAMTNSSMKQKMQTLVATELSKPLSYMLPLTGQAMQPALNAAVKSQSEAHDKLVIRRMSGKSQTFLNRVYVDDVVVVRDPNDKRRKYVRRVAGLAGDQLVSDNTGDETMQIPGDHCWVVRDNDSAAECPDSRKFGPLSIEHILGRVMYAIRSATDHGRVISSPYAMASDAIVLAHEPISHFLRDAPKSSGNQTDSEKKV